MTETLRTKILTVELNYETKHANNKVRQMEKRKNLARNRGQFIDNNTARMML